MLDTKDLLSKWRILILAIGFLIPDLEAARDWSLHKVRAKDKDELTITCPLGSHIVIVYGEYGNRDAKCSDVFNQYNLALKCNYEQVCHFPHVDDGMKTACPEGVRKVLNLNYYCMLGHNTLHYAELTKEDTEYNMKCPVNNHLYIFNATLSDDENRCVIDAQEDVKYSCWDHECTFFEIMKEIKDTCPGLEKKLLITYLCNQVEQIVAFVTEGRPAPIECPHNYIIDILRANYSDPVHECKQNKVDIYIKKKCSSKQRCMIEDTIYYDFPSGCQSDLTEMLVTYRCVQSKETRKFTVFENGLLDLSCFRGYEIKIIHASFGKKNKDCWSENAMENVETVCNGKNKCCGTVNRRFLGESTCLEEYSQKLKVTYECVSTNQVRMLDHGADECQNIRFKISSSFGDITSESFKKMDDNLILMIGTSLPRLEHMSTETYQGIVEYMKDIPSLEIIPESKEERNSSYYSSAEGLTDLISRTTSKYEAIVWYNCFINNTRIINDAHIDIQFLTEIITETGVYVTSVNNLLFGHTSEVVDEVDISILRFPDIEEPHFLVYHIRIVAWRMSDRILIYEKTASGLSGMFQSIKFRPNKSYLASLEPDIIATAKAEAENIFD